MMHPTEIARLSREASQRARRSHKLPLVVEVEDLKYLDDLGLARHILRAPFLGSSYTPEGWEQSPDDLFVDTSGFGTDSEPALSWPQLGAAVREFGPGVGYGFTHVGQFQAYLSVYRPLSTQH